MTDPHAPTPGTENRIDYALLRDLANGVHLEYHQCTGCRFVAAQGFAPHPGVIVYCAFHAALDPATVLALVRKARQRDAAERGIGDCIKEISVSALTGEIPDRAFTKGRLDGLGFALNALRKA